MPVPFIALAYLVPGLIAAGGVAWEWMRPEKDPEWADKTVFNDRMRQLQTHLLDMNKALSACPSFTKNSANLSAWRNFLKNWSAWYKEVGKLEYFAPNDSQISNAKLYTSQLIHWVETLKTYKECVSPANAAPPTVPPPPDSVPDWVVPAALGVAAALYLTRK